MQLAKYIKTKDAAKLQSLCEAIADIAQIAGSSGYYSGNSRDNIEQFIEWAIIFEKRNSARQWDGEYMDEIEAFTQKQIERAVIAECKNRHIQGGIKAVTDYCNTMKWPKYNCGHCQTKTAHIDHQCAICGTIKKRRA